MDKINAILLNEKDNVVTLFKDVKEGDDVEFQQAGDILKVVALQDTPAFHKIAILNIDLQAPIFKYGEMIGFTKKSIRIGEHVHTHNLSSKGG